jgi:hypothetical protein
MIVFFDFIIHYRQFNACLLEHLSRISISMVTLVTNHTFYASVNYHHGAGSAGCHFAEKCRSLKRYTKPSCLNDCVLFRMKSTYTMLGHIAVIVKNFTHVMSRFITMGQTRRSTNIPSGHNSLVFNNYTAASSAVASGTPSHSFE